MRFVLRFIFEGACVVIEKNSNLMATGKIETTIDDIDMYADNWVELAAEKTDAVKGNTYVQLNRGILTVDQIDGLLDSIPLEFSFIDSNNQFIYYNYEKEPHEMLAASQPESVGQPLGTLHPEAISDYVSRIEQMLRAGTQGSYHIGHPIDDGLGYLVHSYQRIEDKDENYLGINEHVADIKPIIDWYLKQTKQKLVSDDEVDATTSASLNDSKDIPNDVSDAVDGITSASTRPDVKKT